MSTTTVAQLRPDLAQALAFLAHFGPPEAEHCFQTFDDGPGKDPTLARTLHGPLTSLWRQLVALNNRGAGVFFTVNEIAKGQRRYAGNTLRVRAFVADLDDATRRQQVEHEIARRGPQPSFIVESSPGKRHYYWLTSDCPLDSFKPMQLAIAAALGTDATVCDLSRVMRLPGFVHRKGTPFLVREVAA